ncbi:hypothetical protein I4U23_004713 [Adineta vaga]|nr:hypothetical protein I4U23_004713 [Adineta vaga]
MTYLCLCDLDRRANRFDFEHKTTFNFRGQDFCENQAHCLKNDPQCPTTSNNTTSLTQSRVIENFIIIWLDADINEFDEDTKDSITNLRHIDETVSYAFAASVEENPELIGILFQVEINPLISTVPFASLDKISYYDDIEREILFSMHTVFRIGEMKKMKDRLWKVNLILTSDNDQQLKELTDCIRKEHQNKNQWHRMAGLMMTMGNFSKALEIFDLIGDQHCKANSEIYRYKEDYMTALSYYEKTLSIWQKFLPSNHTSLAILNGNMAMACKGLCRYEQAIKHAEQAVDIASCSFGLHHSRTIAYQKLLGDLQQN